MARGLLHTAQHPCHNCYAEGPPPSIMWLEVNFAACAEFLGRGPILGSNAGKLSQRVDIVDVTLALPTQKPVWRRMGQLYGERMATSAACMKGSSDAVRDTSLQHALQRVACC